MKNGHLQRLDNARDENATTYSTRYFTEDVPRHQLPDDGMPPRAAYQLVHDELYLDGNPALNLATFVTTWMEPEANQLIAENEHKNFIDHDEYPQTGIIEQRCVDMLAHLYNAPEDGEQTGASTEGSSEAIMLGLLAAKWRWRLRRKAEGKPTDNPNVVMGADVHTVWEKFARYFDVEPRIVPMETDRQTLTAELVGERIDENTICVGAVMGTTFTGQSDPVHEINDYLLEVKESKGLDIPIHVDAASGGFVVPFTEPDRVWDFRLPQVKSINVSGHKFGLVYPGIGWLIFRDKQQLPDEIVFHVNYLGGEMPTFTLNFSGGSSMVLAQYYNFLRLGRGGYEKIMKNTMENASYLKKNLEETGKFEVIGKDIVLPTVVVSLKDSSKFTVYDLSEKLRERGWIVPAYTLPPNAESIAVLRIVVKENFSRDMADNLIRHGDIAISELEQAAGSSSRDASTKHPVC